MRSRRVAVVTALALVMGLVPVLATVCVGWEGSAKARMACCVKSDGAADAAAADACCKDGEGRTHGVAGGAATLPALSLAGPVPPVRAHEWSAATDDRARNRAPDVPTHLLLDVFLL